MPTTLDLAERVYHRSLTLALLSMRFTMEFASKGSGIIRSDDVYIYDKMHAILSTSAPLRDTLTSQEEKLLSMPLGEWAPALIAEMSWCSEEAGTLLWAIKKIDVFPSPEEPFTLEFLNKYVSNFFSIDWILPCSKNKVSLREIHEIEMMKRQLELLLQRCIAANRIRYEKTKLPLRSYEDIFHFTEAGLSVGPSGDLLVGIEEFCDFSEVEEQMLVPIATSRIHALAWALDPTQKWEKFNIDYLYQLPSFEKS